jgi:hypothetical protein
MTQLARWRGLKALVADAVEHGSRAVERVHMATARRPFVIIEHVPGVAVPTHIVHAVHDVIVTQTYDTIRRVNRAVSIVLDVTLDVLETRALEPPDAAPKSL